MPAAGKMSLAILCAVLLAACNAAAPRAMIRPGDQIGTFLVVPMKENEAKYAYDLHSHCVLQGKAPVSFCYWCEVPVGTPVNITTGLDDETSQAEAASQKLEVDWQSFQYELFIEDHPVDLEAFGTIDKDTANWGVMRFWNVAVQASQPGQIALREVGQLPDGKPFEMVIVLSFNEP